MKSIGFLVSENYDERIARAKVFQDEFAALTPEFKKLGFQLDKVCWSKAASLDKYVGLVPKAAWDYFDVPDQFTGFLRSLEASSVRMVNSLKTVQWNMNKRYLMDFKRAGLPMLDLELVPRGTSPDRLVNPPFPQCSKLLLKPSVSGGSKNTIVCDRNDFASQRELMATILADCDLVIQPFYEEVAQGEFSFFYFGGTFSHAILKTPKAGDFRAHSFFGSAIDSYDADSIEITAAKKFLSLCPDHPAYARVDLLKVDGAFHLVELEVIEPYLYLQWAPDPDRAAFAFAKAVVGALDSMHPL